MNTMDLKVPQEDLTKLLAAAGGDVALLYLYVHSGNAPEQAQKELNMTAPRYDCAAATLRQLGLWPERKQVLIMGERPTYSEGDVLNAMDTDRDFRSVYGELQRLLGRSLNTEEMKIVLGFTRYLGLTADVICLLVCYCVNRAKQQKRRTPSLRTIEKEAYFWAENGIDTVEEASAFIQRRNQQNSRIGQLMQKLQIHGRNLTAAEEKYARRWLEAGFDLEVLGMAYEKTCLNTGGLNWNYMDKILIRWQEEGLMTPEQVKAGDKKKKSPIRGASGKLGAAEKENIRRLLQED